MNTPDDFEGDEAYAMHMRAYLHEAERSSKALEPVFDAQFPRLLKEHAGEWIAYALIERRIVSLIGKYGDTVLDLIQKNYGVTPGSVYMRRIVEEPKEYHIEEIGPAHREHHPCADPVLLPGAPA